MKRGFAIALVYLALVGVIGGLTALLVPPIVNEATNLADNAPRYVAGRARLRARRTSA